MRRNANLSALNLLKHLQLAYFSKPAAERTVYRFIRRRRPRSLVEIGIGDGVRAQRMIKQCVGFLGAEQFRYTGIDLFEGRDPTRPGMTIKLAHKVLKPLAGKVQLVPGDPFSALSRTANSLTQTDLVLVGADQDPQSMERAWFYLPRMLSERSLVLLEQEESSSQKSFRPISLSEITKLAERPSKRRVA